MNFRQTFRSNLVSPNLLNGFIVSIKRILMKNRLLLNFLKVLINCEIFNNAAQ